MNDVARASGGVRERSSGEEETGLRFMFLEAIMERARKSDVEGVEEALTGMALAGLDAGPRAYHGLVVAYTRAGDAEGAVRIIMYHRALSNYTFLAVFAYSDFAECYDYR